MSIISPEILNGSAQEWMGRLFTATWQGGLAAAGVWLVCRSVRLTPRMRCWLWWAVGVRLVVGLLPLGVVRLAVLPAPPRVSQTDWTGRTGRMALMSPIGPISAQRSETEATEEALPAPEEALPPPTPISPAVWLMAAWLVGVAVRLVVTARQAYALRRLARRAVPVEDPAVNALLLSLLAEAGVRRGIPLREHTAVRSPLITGLIRPVILMPASEPNAAMDLSPEELRMALAHEVVHLRRKDLLFSVLPYLAQALFFFHPFAWLAAREHRLALEAACDQEALRLTGAPVSEYGRLLLRFAGSAERRIAAALGAASGFRTLERRLNMLQNAPFSISRSAKIAVGLALATLAGMTIPWRLEAQQSETKAQSVTLSAVSTGATVPTAKAAKQKKKAAQGAKASAKSARPIGITFVTTGQAALAAPTPTAAVTGQLAPAATPVADGDTPTEAAIAPAAGQVNTPAPIGATIAPEANRSTPAPQAVTVSSGPTPRSPLAITSSGAIRKPATTTISGHTHGVTATGGRINRALANGNVMIASSANRSTRITAPAMVYSVPAAGAPLALANGNRNVLSVASRDELAVAPTLHFDNVSLQSALRTLFSRTHSDYVLALGDELTANVSGEYKGVAVSAVLDNILERSGARHNFSVLDEHGIYIVTKAGEEPVERVTLKFYQRNVADALDAFFAASHVNYTIDPSLQRPSLVTASLQNTSFRDALQTLLRSMPVPATYHTESGIFHIVPKDKD